VLGGQLGARIRLAQQLAVRVGELPPAPVTGHLAGEQAVQPRLHVLLPPRLPEEHQGELATAVGDGDLGQLAAAAAHRAAGHLGDLGQHGDVVPVPQRGQVGQLAAALVPARVVPEQLADRPHAQGGAQRLGRARIELPVQPVV
jgi:hypothetical protein